MRNLKKLVSTTAIYFLGSATSKLIAFFMLPLYTHFIEPAQYGLYDLYVSYTNLFYTICFFSLWNGVMKLYFDAQTEEAKTSVINSSLLLFSISSVVFGSVFYVFGIITSMESLLVVIVYGIFSALNEYYGYCARSMGRNIRFAVSGMIASAVIAVTNIVLLQLNFGYISLFLSYCAGVFVQVIILESSLKILKNFSWHTISVQLIKRLLKFSWPISLSSLAFWFYSGYNRFIIVQKLGEEANGYFAVATKFGMMIAFVAACFAKAWQEFSFARGDYSEETRRTYADLATKYSYLLVLGFGLFTVFTIVVFPFFINERYQAARYLIPLYMLVSVMDAYHAFLAGIVNTYYKSHLVFISMLAGCLLNILLIHVLIGRMGVYAAIVSMLAGYTLSNIIRMRIVVGIIQFKPKINYLFAISVIGLSLLNYWKGGWVTTVCLTIGLLFLAWKQFGSTALALLRKWKGVGIE